MNLTHIAVNFGDIAVGNCSISDSLRSTSSRLGRSQKPAGTVRSNPACPPVLTISNIFNSVNEVIDEGKEEVCIVAVGMVLIINRVKNWPNWVKRKREANMVVILCVVLSPAHTIPSNVLQQSFIEAACHVTGTLIAALQPYKLD